MCKEVIMSQKIIDLVTAVVAPAIPEPYELVDIEYEKLGGDYVLSVLIDKPGGITVEDTADLTEIISPLLDTIQPDPFPDQYMLEVSSPGLERPLKTKEALTNAVGQYINVSLYKAIDKISLLFWRSFAHLIGGMGVLVFALAIMNNSKNGHHEVMRAEVPGPVFGKVVAKLKNTAQILYIIYLTMFVIFAVILWLCGMPIFDSIITAMGGAGTGGFAVYNDSIAHYHSDLITYVVTVGTLLFGVNFNLYFYILLRKIKFFFQDEELRTYFAIVAISTGLIILNIFGIYHNLADSFKYSFFEVSTIITTTGFGLTDITKWPLFSQYILLLLMFIGGSAGSTAGGFKVIRAMIIAKIARNQTLASLYPNRILSLHINGSVLDKETQHSVLKYLAVYVLIILSLVTVLSLDNQDLLIVTSAAASTFNNIGPLLGTTDSFAIFSPLSKLIMGFAMIAGRLEIYPLLLLFLPKTWSKT